MFDDRIKKIKYQMRIRNITNPDQQLPHVKHAFTPDQAYNPAAAGGGMPMSPLGGMPIDPSMMGGAMPPGGMPMDPSMMGGAMPPGGMPMDPSMMGGIPMQPGAPIGMDPNSMAMMAQMSGGVPLSDAGAGPKKEKGQKEDLLVKIYTDLDLIKKLLVALLRRVGEPVVGVDELLAEAPSNQELPDENRIRSEVLLDALRQMQESGGAAAMPPQEIPQEAVPPQ